MSVPPPAPDAAHAAEPQHPTLLVGLGAFGREVARVAFGDAAGPIQNLVFLADGEPAEVVRAAKEALRSLLDLAPTAARILGLDGSGMQGRVLEELLIDR